MKVNEAGREDWNGNYPIEFSKVRSIKEIHDWLWSKHWGYKFVIVFDETKVQLPIS